MIELISRGQFEQRIPTMRTVLKEISDHIVLDVYQLPVKAVDRASAVTDLTSKFKLIYPIGNNKVCFLTTCFCTPRYTCTSQRLELS